MDQEGRKTKTVFGHKLSNAPGRAPAVPRDKLVYLNQIGGRTAPNLSRTRACPPRT